MRSHRDLLVVCCYIQASTLVERTIAAFADCADLVLVPVQADVPPLPAALPFQPPAAVRDRIAQAGPVKKWRAVRAVLDTVDRRRWRWFMFPDDDLEYCDDFAGRFFPVLEQHDLALAQPALTADSYHTYDLCVRKPGNLARLTNFVEVMAPCFRRDALRRLLPTIDAGVSPMGYGMDLHWGYACQRYDLRMGIVDHATVAHRFRPTGRFYAGDDLHHQGIEYGRRFPRILIHEIGERGRIPLPAGASEPVINPTPG